MKKKKTNSNPLKSRPGGKYYDKVGRKKQKGTTKTKKITTEDDGKPHPQMVINSQTSPKYPWQRYWS